MNTIITKKVRLIPSPFVGTQFDILITPEERVFGFFSGTLADGSSEVTVDWGDGTTERFAAFSQITHTYADPGEYQIRISDDLAEFSQSSLRTADYWTYAARLLRVRSNAANLAKLLTAAFRHAVNLASADFTQSGLSKLGAFVFSYCHALGPKIYLPNVNELGTSVFLDCPGVLEIHFSKAHEAEIKAGPAYQETPPLSAENAEIFFDPV